QQVAVVARMAADLSMPVEVVSCPTMRESDGLAMSSRNIYLTSAERAEAPVLRRALDAGLAVIAEGEVAQLTTANDTTTSEEAYLYVIRSKTAALFAAACEVGGLIAGQSETVTNALEQYGANLGIAFQLVDDYLDYASSAEAMGKEVGDDFRDGKITLPIVLAMRRGDDEERRFWQRTLEDGEQYDTDLEHAAALLQKHGALTDTLIRARGYADTARAALSNLPDNDHRAALEDVIDFCVDRAY
ncbi:MAG: hypothetical protein EBY61_10455, partial [Actinobacteria bacterium]|nr:hypothetical protein [Actinomycetota bacterium]